jgi:hypothetical protein
MVAKRFFYICAGLLCLALAYHLGARSALGSGAGIVDGAHVDCDRGPNGTVFVTGVVGRNVYWNGEPAALPAIPGTERIVATCGGGDFFTVVLENGDIYRGLGGQWTYLGNIVAKATPATQGTWGEIKSKYREGAKAQDK